MVAVIDWEDAALGDPLADVANARLEILWAIGTEAMHRFTEEYRSMMPNVDFTYLPLWDLYAALRPVSSISGWEIGGCPREHHAKATPMVCPTGPGEAGGRLNS